MPIEKLLELSNAFVAGLSIGITVGFSSFLGVVVIRYLARKESKMEYWKTATPDIKVSETWRT